MISQVVPQDFTLDLIAEILVFLPVKSLGQYKVVSKPWRSLISSPAFIKKHFSKSVQQQVNHKLLFLCDYTSDTFVYPMNSCSLSAALDTLDSHRPPVVVSDVEFPSPNPSEIQSFGIVGIVNGLVCLSVDAKCLINVYICNPILKQSKLVDATSASHSASILLKCKEIVGYGFGYDESNDDYKVVGLSPSGVKVYSLMSDSWRKIEGFQCISYSNVTSSNGKFWWSCLSARDKKKRIIVKLDMATDKYEELEVPCLDGSVGCVGGSLTWLGFSSQGAELWVMVHNSWSKLFSWSNEVQGSTLTKVLCISGDGDIVFGDISSLGNMLTVYRTKTKAFGHIRLAGVFFSDFNVYVESLVAV